MKKQLKIPTTKDRFYRIVLTILSPIPPLRNLPHRELLVLSELIRLADKHKDLQEDIKWRMVFDCDSKTEIRKSVYDDNRELSEASLNNSFTHLRKVGIIKENTVVKDLLFSPENLQSINFELYIQ